jgi:myo-inositol-1(or 4)-monophosphatase
MHPTVKIAIRAAYNAGDIILRHHNQIDSLNIDKKAEHDFVSEIDKQAEEAIISEIRKFFPEHSILGEESGELLGTDNKCKWVIDPLDGTTNYLHGFPQYSVSIAMFEGSTPQHAVVFDPFKNELFYATKGQGAFIESDKDNKRIRVSQTSDMATTLIGTGFPFKMPQHLDTYLETFRAIHPQTAGIRRAGSAALDLAYVAAGRMDGFWEIGLNIWDIAAGVLLITEAGGFVGDFAGGGEYFTTGNVVAGNKHIFKEVLKTIKPHLTAELQK